MSNPSISSFSLGDSSAAAFPPLSIRLSFGAASSSSSAATPAPPPPLGAAAGGGGAAEAPVGFAANLKPLSCVNWSDGERAYHAAIFTWREVQDGPVPLLPVSLYRSPTLRSTCGSGSGSGDGGSSSGGAAGGGGGADDDDRRISFNTQVTVFSKPTPLLGAVLEEKVDLKSFSGGGASGGAGGGSFGKDAEGAATPRN